MYPRSISRWRLALGWVIVIAGFCPGCSDSEESAPASDPNHPSAASVSSTSSVASTPSAKSSKSVAPPRTAVAPTAPLAPLEDRPPAWIESGTLTVAVLPFGTDSPHYTDRVNAASFPDLLQQMIQPRQPVRWVDREQVERARAEFNLQAFGGSGPIAELSMGRWVGADVVVRGRYLTSDPDFPVLQLSVVDLLRAQTLAQSDVSPSTPGAGIAGLNPESVSRVIGAMLDEARQNLEADLDRQHVAFLFFRNLSPTPRLDRVEAQFMTKVASRLNTEGAMGLLRFDGADESFAEQELAVLGLSDSDPDTWRRVADYYAWGNYEELSDGSGEEIPFNEVSVKLTLNVWDGIGEVFSQTETTTVEDLTTAQEALLEGLVSRATKPRVGEATRHARQEVVDQLHKRYTEIVRAKKDSQEDHAILMYRTRLMELASFFDPECFTSRDTQFDSSFARTWRTDPHHGWDLMWRSLRQRERLIDFAWERAHFPIPSYPKAPTLSTENNRRLDLLKGYIEALTHAVEVLRGPESARDFSPQRASLGESAVPSPEEASYQALVPYGAPAKDITQWRLGVIEQIKNAATYAEQLIAFEQYRLDKGESPKRPSRIFASSVTSFKEGKRADLLDHYESYILENLQAIAESAIHWLLYLQDEPVQVADAVEAWWPYTKQHYFVQRWKGWGFAGQHAFSVDPGAFEYRLARVFHAAGRADEIDEMLWLDKIPDWITTTAGIPKATPATDSNTEPAPKIVNAQLQPYIEKFETAKRTQSLPRYNENAGATGQMMRRSSTGTFSQNTTFSVSPGQLVVTTKPITTRPGATQPNQNLRGQPITQNGLPNPDLSIPWLPTPMREIRLRDNDQKWSTILSMHAGGGVLWLSLREQTDEHDGSTRFNQAWSTQAVMGYDPATDHVWNIANQLPEALNNVPIDAFFTQDQHLWLATRGQHVARVDFSASDLSTQLFDEQDGVQHQEAGPIVSLNNRLYFLGKNESLNVYDPQTGIFSDLDLGEIVASVDGSLHYTRATPFKSYKQLRACGNWLVIGDENPILFNVQTKEARRIETLLKNHFKETPRLDGQTEAFLSANRFQVSTSDVDDETIWMATALGLYQYQPNTDQWNRWALPLFFAKFKLVVDDSFVWLLTRDGLREFKRNITEKVFLEQNAFVFDRKAEQWAGVLPFRCLQFVDATLDQQGRLWIGLNSRQSYNLLEIDTHAVYRTIDPDWHPAASTSGTVDAPPITASAAWIAQIGDTQLEQAAYLGNVAQTQKLLDAGAAPDGLDRDGLTPLMAAVRGGHHEIVSLLLKKGADPKRASTALIPETTVFTLAASYGRGRIGETIRDHLIEQDGNITLPTRLLYDAAKNGHAETVEIFLDFLTGVINEHPEKGQMIRQVIAEAITFAKSTDQKAMVSLIEAHPIAGQAPGKVIAAASTGDLKLLQSLLDSGENPNETNRDGITPLIVASTEGDDATVDFLLAYGADPNARFGQGLTPLMAACQQNHFTSAQRLLEAGADPNLFRVIEHDGVLVNGVSKQYLSPLVIAAKSGRYELFELLLKHGADLNADVGGVPQGDFVMVEAGVILQLPIMGYLASKGFDLNAKDPDGQTILHRAAMTTIVDWQLDLLLELGADPRVRNRSSQTPMQTAKANTFSMSQKTIQKLSKAIMAFESKPTSSPIANRSGWPSPWLADHHLNRAAATGALDNIRAMIQHDAKVDATDLAGRTGIVLAAENGHTDAVSLLLELGADLTGHNIWHETPHEAALAVDQQAVVDLLNAWFKEHGTPKKVAPNAMGVPSPPTGLW